jgi:hypothetical protein
VRGLKALWSPWIGISAPYPCATVLALALALALALEVLKRHVEVLKHHVGVLQHHAKFCHDVDM